MLVASAVVLQIAETMVPHPVPGIRLGLANIIALIALDRYGFRCAMEVAVLRTVVGAFCLGTFLSPPFLLSFASALVSVCAMGAAYQCVASRRHPAFSLIGISLIGATFHNGTQILVAYALLLRHRGVFLLLPWLGLSALATGWLTGVVASLVCHRLSQGARLTAAGPSMKPAMLPIVDVAPTPLGHLPAGLTLGFALTVIGVVLISTSWGVLAGVTVLLAVLAGIARVRMSSLLRPITALMPLILFSFATPLLFTRTGPIGYHGGPVTITMDGFLAGSLFAVRLILLTLCATVAARLSTAEELTAGLEKLLSPLRMVGLSPARLTAIMTLAWQSVPELRARCRRHMGTFPRDRRGWLTGVANWLVNWMISSEPETPADAHQRSESDKESS